MVYAILVLIFYAKIPNNPTYSFLLLLFFFQYIIQLIINNFTIQHIVRSRIRMFFVPYFELALLMYRKMDLVE
jgi:hypothetical protein